MCDKRDVTGKLKCMLENRVLVLDIYTAAHAFPGVTLKLGMYTAF